MKQSQFQSQSSDESDVKTKKAYIHKLIFIDIELEDFERHLREIGKDGFKIIFKVRDNHLLATKEVLLKY
jgi:hypothetical protein